MAYVAPNWRDGAPPALDAEALNAISQALAKLPMENGGTFATSGAAGLYNLINAAATMTSSTLASGDYVGVQDVSAGIGKRTTLSNLASWIVSNGTGAKIATGSYTGTGTYGASNPNSITFPFTPKLVWIYKTGNTLPDQGYMVEMLVWMNGITHYSFGGGYSFNGEITLSGNTLKWVINQTKYTYPREQLNISGIIYRWVAFG